MLNKFSALSCALWMGLSLVSNHAMSAGNKVAYDDAVISASQFDQELLAQEAAQDIAMFIPNINLGDSEKDINALLGSPYSVEHMELGSSFWDYNVSIPTSAESFIGCQYRLEFGVDGLLKSADWRKSVCDLMYRQYIGGAASDNEQRLEVFSLMSDVLFSFNRYQLSASGQKSLDAFIDQLLERYDNPVVTITGHTDRIGSREANLNISKLRAREVGSRFLAKGLTKQNLLIKGVGGSSPIVVCADEQRDTALISCLAPNRRVEIEIYEAL